jgi:DNA-binding XRE family transcriptional regulator
MPFEQAVADVAFFWGVELDETTVRRHTQAAGAAYIAAQAAERERLERERPPAPAGPAVQYLSADGAMVPLVGGQWAEVKTLAIGEVEVRCDADGLTAAQTTNLTYFSRLADADSFTAQAYVETYRRGTETAKVVCAVQDGAEWLQGLRGRTQAELAEQINIRRATIARIESGKPALVKTARAIATALGVEVADLQRQPPTT